MGFDRQTCIQAMYTLLLVWYQQHSEVLYSLLNVYCLLKMDFCQYICKGNSRHIPKYQADSIYWILRFIDIRIYCYRSFVFLHAHMQVDMVRAASPCFKPLSLVCERCPSKNKVFPQSSFRVCILENSMFLDTRFSILDSHVSKLKRLDIRESSFEDRVETVNLHLTSTVLLGVPLRWTSIPSREE